MFADWILWLPRLSFDIIEDTSENSEETFALFASFGVILPAIAFSVFDEYVNSVLAYSAGFLTYLAVGWVANFVIKIKKGGEGIIRY